MRTIYILSLLSLLFFQYGTMAQTIALPTGCNDPKANNFNQAALYNDGSCLYSDTLVKPISTVELPKVIHETSGLLQWNHQLWTQNDGGNDNSIFAIDSVTGKILNRYNLKTSVNHDWEEISQDQDYLYVGDFGNNACGCRTDLNILRVSKKSLLSNDPQVDSIQFSYSNQLSTSAQKGNQTEFDCEAFVVVHDSIYLFTKQWTSGKTSLYSLPKIPGKYQAHYNSSLDIKGLVTGAVYIESKKMIALCGYTKLFQTFMYLLYDFNGNDFFAGNKRKMSLALSFHQVEGITSTDGIKFYLSNEEFSRPPYFSNPQQLHIVQLKQ